MSLAGPLGLLFGWINARDQIGQKNSLTILNTGRRSGIGSVGFCCKTPGGISVGAKSHACAMRLKMRPLAIVSQESSFAAPGNSRQPCLRRLKPEERRFTPDDIEEISKASPRRLSLASSG